MRALIDEWKTRPEMLASATNLIFLTPEKDSDAELQAIFNFMRDQVRYTRDVHGIETLANPLITLRRRSGDCDDKTTLLCTLCEAVGYPTRLVMAAYAGDEDYSHVYAQVLGDTGWLDADCTEREPLGWAPPGAARIYTEGV